MATATIAEVYRSKSWGETSTECLEEFMTVLEDELILPIELDRMTALSAHSLCRKHNTLRPFDAIHIACALKAKCDYLLTWDRKMLDVEHDKLQIVEPFVEAAGLFADDSTATPEEQYAWNLANPRRVRPGDIMFVDGDGI